MSELTERERKEIIATIRDGRRLPARYRASLFHDAAETELIWPGKTSEVERSVLPFQSIEHIDEPRSGTDHQQDLFSVDHASGRQAGGWTNKLIWGDNKLILSSLANGPLRQEIEAAGGIKLVYIDPPFDVGADFSAEISVGDAPSVSKDASIIEEIAYRDTWGNGRASFMTMLHERLVLISSLLADDATFIVHLDYRTVHYVKVLLDECFGSENLINEVVWHWTNAGGRSGSSYARKHNTLLVYRKGRDYTFNWKDAGEKRVQDDSQFGSFFKTGPDGRMYQEVRTKNKTYTYYLDEPKIPDDVWLLQQMGQHDRTERTGYPTQKPESLATRVVLVHSNPGDIVADFFCGSGTVPVVAEKNGRKWIGVDLSRFAIHTSRKRLISLQRQLASENESYRAFEILNLGSYERQYFAGIDMSLPPEQRLAASTQRREQFLTLILGAYGARRSEQLPEFHGTKENACVFVGPLDAPVTHSDITTVVAVARRYGVPRVDVLGFEFEMGIKPAMADQAKEEGVTLTLRYIPNDVFDTRAIAKGQVKFFDVGYVEVKPKQAKDGSVTIGLEDFGVFYAQQDADVAAAGLKNGGSRVIVDNGQVVRVAKDKKGILKKEILTESWQDWIDYWAVDYDFESQREIIAVTEGDATKETWTGRYIFENQWQDFRVRGDRSLRTVSDPHTYDTPGEYKIAVKVVDVFGNDTTKVVKLKVK